MQTQGDELRNICAEVKTSSGRNGY